MTAARPLLRRQLAVAFAAALFTLLVSVLPFVSFAYRSPEAHVALETTAFVVTLLAAALFVGRVRTLRRRTDLVVVVALLLLAASSFCFGALPGFLGLDRSTALTTWAPMLGRLASVVALAVAAWVPERELADPTRALVRAAGLAAAGLAVVALVVAVAGDALPATIDRTLSPEEGTRPRIVGSASILAIQLAGMLAAFAAAVGFGRRADRTGDELSAMLGVAAVLGAFARLNFFLFPSNHSEWIYTGDVLRLGFHLVLLTGIALEVARTQRAQAEVAVLEERRRLAREIHDGLAQELAFIAGRADLLGARAVGPPELVGQLGAAARRALDESRAAIDVLTTPPDEPLDQALHRAAEQVADRYGVRVRADLDEHVVVSPEARHALTRIVREAVANAARHGEARHVDLAVHGPAPVVVRVADDGTGFDPERAPSGGFGLISMRERAEALGGSLTVDGAAGRGAVVEVRVP